MPATRAAIRFITLFFLLAGILLLRKPVFGQTIAAPQRQSINRVCHDSHTSNLQPDRNEPRRCSVQSTQF